MPIKFGQLLDVTIGIPKPDGTMEYVKLEGIQNIENLTELSDDGMEIITRRQFRTWEGSLTVKWQNYRAMYYFLKYGNDLYLRFPKKLRRKKCKTNNLRMAVIR